MAISYTATAFNSAGSSGGTNLTYKDVTVTVAVGDLVVATGHTANANGVGDGTCAVQAGPGTVGTWTIGYRNKVSETPGFIMAHAVATGAGSLTVRVTVSNAGTMVMGAAVWVVPASEWSGTPQYTTFGTNVSDASPNVIVDTLDSSILYSGCDWSGAGAPGTGTTPAGGTVDTNSFVSGNYASSMIRWIAQSTGTRGYGPSAPAGNQWTGAILELEPGVAGEDSGPNYAGAAASLGGGDGSWANTGNATGTVNTTYAVWTAP